MTDPGSVRPLPRDGGAPRVRPGGFRELGLRNWAITRVAGLGMGTASPNLFATMGRHRSLFRHWLVLASRLMPRGRLPRHDTELAILRVAHLRGAVYEHQHHVRVGRPHGIDPDVVRRIQGGPDAAGWSPRERALLSAVDGLVRDGDLDDPTWAALREHLDEQDAIELVVLVGQYDALATFLGTLRIAPDDPQPLRRRLGRAVGR
jgi:alkylhydroperoxidase family enzyme